MFAHLSTYAIYCMVYFHHLSSPPSTPVCANSRRCHSVVPLHPGLRGCRSSTPMRLAAFYWFPSRQGDRGWILRQLATPSLWSCLRVRRGCDRRKTDFTDAIRCAVAHPDRCVCAVHIKTFFPLVHSQQVTCHPVLVLSIHRITIQVLWSQAIYETEITYRNMY